MRPRPPMAPLAGVEVGCGLASRRVRIVTDSTADVPQDIAAALGIAVVPCLVYVGEEQYQDGLDLEPEAFFQIRAQNSRRARTAHPPVASFLETYQRLLAEDRVEKLLSIHIAASLSGTLNSAWAAAQMLPDPSRVEIIDTGQLSMGAGWAVIEAARAAQNGTTPRGVQDLVDGLLPRLRAAVVVDTLDDLFRGGRISQLSALLGTALQIKPLLSIQAGRVSIVRRVRTQSRALRHLANLVQGWGPLAELAVLHTGAPVQAQALAEELQKALPEPDMIVRPAGAALATHLGLGAIGVCGLVDGNRASFPQDSNLRHLKKGDTLHGQDRH
jgi:DegV family protein with EDD domain